ncbi:hypothetical protein GCM10009802_28330 [Streptomyces synnematoformans]|uniref:Integral membrane protein n=1 Tax=Streptomyces synnematoformans TaxID=415721 RepID=A0ABN2Y8W7_9ACTN
MLRKLITTSVACAGCGVAVAWIGVTLSDSASSYEREACRDSSGICITGAEPAAAVGWFLIAVAVFALLIGVTSRERRQGWTAGLLLGPATVLVPLWLDSLSGEGEVGTSIAFWAASAIVPGVLGYVVARKRAYATDDGTGSRGDAE